MSSRSVHHILINGLFKLCSYMLAHGVLASQADNKGDLPLHLALDRALQLQPDQAAEGKFSCPLIVCLSQWVTR